MKAILAKINVFLLVVLVTVMEARSMVRSESRPNSGEKGN